VKPEELLRNDKLVWFTEAQIGYVDPGQGIDYGKVYYDEYVRRSRSELSNKLMDARCDLVQRWYDGTVVDIGAGACAFVERLNGREQKCLGYDINPVTVFDLQERDLYYDVMRGPRVEAVCFFDVLEHFLDPSKILARVEDLIFMSIPIFSGPQHCLSSRHLKVGEHIWYFTHQGLIDFMNREGFTLLEDSTMESDICREDISSYVFRRKGG